MSGVSVSRNGIILTVRSMKHFFFLDQSDFLTNFLDLASSELRKQSKQASIVKLQSLLDLAIRNPGSSSSNDLYKDNLKVTIASQGLYDWLIKIVSRTGGGLGDDGGELDFGSGERFEDDAAASKTLFGESTDRYSTSSMMLTCSTRCGGIRFFGQIPSLARHLAQDNHPIPAHFPLLTPPASSRIGPIDHVARPQGAQLARRLRQ